MLDLGMQILKWLAVAGGATVGWLGSGLLVRLLVRLSLHRAVPRKLLLPVRALGALALGLAVWVGASSSGGLGPGLGGWFGTGDGKLAAKTESGRSAEPSAEPAASAAKRAGTDSQPQPGQDTMRIEILGGARVQEKRFYLLEGEKEPRTLSEVRKAIQARRQEKDKTALKGIVIMIYGSSVARDHPAVKNLATWAEENGLSITFPPTNGAAP